MRISTIGNIYFVVEDNYRQSTGSHSFNFSVSDFKLFQKNIFIKILFYEPIRLFQTIYHQIIIIFLVLMLIFHQKLFYQLGNFIRCIFCHQRTTMTIKYANHQGINSFDFRYDQSIFNFFISSVTCLLDNITNVLMSNFLILFAFLTKFWIENSLLRVINRFRMGEI